MFIAFYLLYYSILLYHWDLCHLVFFLVQLLLGFAESLQGKCDVFIVVGGSGYQSVDDLSFRDHRVHHDRAEDVIILAQVEAHSGSLGDIALEVDRRYRRVGMPDVEAPFFQALLQLIHIVPQLRFKRRLTAHQFHPFQVADHDRQGDGFSEDLRAHVIAQVVNNSFVTAHESADGSAGFCEGIEQQVYLILYALFFTGTSAGFTHGTEAVGIVYQEAELIFIFQGGYLFELALVAGHAEHTFCYYQDTAAGGFGHFHGTVQLLFTVGYIIVLEYVTVSLMQAQAIYDTGVALRIIYNHIPAVTNGVYGTHNALVTVVQEGGIFFTHVIRQHFFQLLMVIGISAHHAGAHR